MPFLDSCLRRNDVISMDSCLCRNDNLDSRFRGNDVYFNFLKRNEKLKKIKERMTMAPEAGKSR